MFIKKEKEKQEAEETKRRIPTKRYEPDYKE